MESIASSAKSPTKYRGSGVVHRVIWRDETSGYSILSVASSKNNITVKGYTYAAKGQRVFIDGEMSWNPKFGCNEVSAKSIVATEPVTIEGAIAYLSSGIVSRVGEKTARKLVAHFGIEVFAILDSDPEKIREVPGIKGKTADRLIGAWKERQAVNEIMLFLRSQGISEAYSRRIYKTYGNQAIAEISRNPYVLCRDVRGIGFKIADEIAIKLGVPKNSEQRIRAGILFTLSELQKNGHTGTPKTAFLDASVKVLEVEKNDIEGVLDVMISETPKRVCIHDGIVFAEWLARAEEEIAAFLADRANARIRLPADKAAVLAIAERRAGISLTEDQKLAVDLAISSPMFVLTGGPGCGKTSTLSAMLAAFEGMGLTISLAAPTGKAAMRMKEATGMHASTIHRMLKLGSEMSDPVPVESDVLVIDEASMIDVPLMQKIVRAVGNGTRLVLVGDSDQLPSVGPGSVLRDIIQSGKVPVVRLNKVFRQAEGSLIITNAHAVRGGGAVRMGSTDSDFWIIDERNYAPIMRAMTETSEDERPGAIASAVANIMVRLVTERIPERKGIDPRDIWVLSPMNGGECGVKRMNELLREAINPSPAKQITQAGNKFGVGDRVIQLRNNYTLNIFNGDSGTIYDIDDEEQEVIVDFDGDRRVRIPYDDMEDMALSYAVTVHKSQGSQMPAVVIPMVTQHYMMLQRNVIYTAITRARHLAVLVGVSRAIAIAIKNNRSQDRITRMRQLFG